MAKAIVAVICGFLFAVLSGCVVHTHGPPPPPRVVYVQPPEPEVVYVQSGGVFWTYGPGGYHRYYGPRPSHFHDYDRRDHGRGHGDGRH